MSSCVRRFSCTRHVVVFRAACVAGLVTGLVSAPAAAEVSAADKALAQALFEKGRALMDERSFSEACPKLAESQRLDPGGGTLLNLGMCLEGAGKTASAWATFEEAIVAARQDNRPDRAKFSQERINALKPKLSYVVLELTPAADTQGLLVEMDDKPVGRAMFNTEVPLDPGTHRVQASAPGNPNWVHVFELGPNGNRVRIALPILVAPQAAATLGGPAPMSARAQSPAADTGAQGEEKSNTRTTVAYVAGGVGIAGLAAGSYFGLKAFSAWSDRQDHCSGSACDARGVELGDDTNTNATIANVAFGIGLAGVGVSAYLLLTSPGESEAGQARRDGVWISAAPRQGGSTLGLGGTW